MFCFVADGINGPYYQLANYAIMAYTEAWTIPAYFLSFYPTSEHGMLCNHQSVGPGGGTLGGDFIAPLKAVHIDTDGSLRLVYWHGNDALKGSALEASGPLGSAFVAHGAVRLPFGGNLSFVSCGEPQPAAAVVIDGQSLVMSVYVDGVAVESVDRALTLALVGGLPEANFTVLSRGGMFEFYFSDFLLLPARFASALGCIELVGAGGLRVTNVWNMTDMPPQIPVPTAPTYPPTPETLRKSRAIL